MRKCNMKNQKVSRGRKYREEMYYYTNYIYLHRVEEIYKRHEGTAETQFAHCLKE